MRAAILNRFACVVGTALTCLSTAAGAAPIVQVGSTYFFRIFDAVTPGVTLNGVVFDGAPSVYTIGGKTLTMSESQTDNGNGSWTIVLRLDSDTDLNGSSDLIASRFGHGDPLDLLQPVRLTSAIMTVGGLDAQGAPYSLTGEGISALDSAYRDPWTGYLGNAPGTGWGYTGVGGVDFRNVEWTLTVNAVPETGSVALVGLALGALAWSRRRGRHQ